MNIRFWGVRGSKPAPLTPAHFQIRMQEILKSYENRSNGESIGEFLKKLKIDPGALIGGNTTCIALESKAGKFCIFDCGSGMQELAKSLMDGKCGVGKGELHIFFSHLHIDRLIGLIDFAPLHVKGNQIHFYYPERGMERCLYRMHSPPYHEQALDSVPADCHYHTLQSDKKLSIGDLNIEHHILMHPGSSYAYKIQEGSFRCVYVGSGKLEIEDTLTPVENFIASANILLIDARPAHQISTFNWGHTDYDTALKGKARWDIEHLFILNHPPQQDDRSIWHDYYEALQTVPDPHQIYFAREGQSIVQESK